VVSGTRWHTTGHSMRREVFPSSEAFSTIAFIKAICLHEESGHALGLRKCLKWY